MKKIDYLLLLGIIVISLFGVLMIYSSSYVWAEYKFNDAFKFVKTQSLFLFVGYILMYFIHGIRLSRMNSAKQEIFRIVGFLFWQLMIKHCRNMVR